MSLDRKASSLTARSVLASVLLGTDPPWLPTRLLVRTAEVFGISEGTARTALSRMVTAGEAETARGGYQLIGRLVTRQDRQAASRRAVSARQWDGTWELAAVDADGSRPAADRAALREALYQLRLVELREGLWGRPDNLEPTHTGAASDVAAQWCRWWHGARPEPSPAVADLWDLDGWAARAEALRSEMDALLPALEADDRRALAAGFVASADVLRHLQADPLLPPDLLPATWPGDAFRTEYDRYDRAYRAVLRGWLAEAP